MEPHPSAPRSRPAGRRLRRLLAAALFAAAAGGLFLWIARRGGEDFFGAPDRLLPPDTAIAATWRDFRTFLSDAEALPAVRRMRGDENLAALLLEAFPDGPDLQRKLDQPQYRLLGLVLRGFADRWFGREVTLAFLPPGPSAAPEPFGSGLLVIARTNIGFEENLAEIAAQWMPDFQLEQENYRGTVLSRYAAPKNRNAFAYCRFGKTVVVSLRSPDFQRLEAVVDRKLGRDMAGRALPVLSAVPAFRAARGWQPSSRGLRVFLAPRETIRMFRAFPSESADGANWNFWLDYLSEQWKPVEWAALHLDLHGVLRVSSFWKTAAGPLRHAAPGGPSAAASPDFLEELPAGASVFCSLRSERLRDGLIDLSDRLAGSAAYGREWPRWMADFRSASGIALREAALPVLGRECAAVLAGLGGGALFPLPRLQAWWECGDASGARSLGRRIAAGGDAPNPLENLWNRLDVRADGRWLRLGFNAPPPAPGVASSSARFRHILAAERPPRAGNAALPIFCLLVDLEQAYLQIARLHSAAALWSSGVRRDFARWETALAAARSLSSLRLTIDESSDGIGGELLVLMR